MLTRARAYEGIRGTGPTQGIGLATLAKESRTRIVRDPEVVAFDANDVARGRYPLVQRHASLPGQDVVEIDASAYGPDKDGRLP